MAYFLGIFFWSYCKSKSYVLSFKYCASDIHEIKMPLTAKLQESYFLKSRRLLFMGDSNHMFLSP